MLVLCIETSCDETSAALVRDGRQILSNIVASQIDVHARYGGVVPELASRKHLEAIPLVIDEALRVADCTLADVEGLALTRGPGLIGALLVGLSTGKALALARAIPAVGVHHIEGHILAPLLETKLEFPFLALAVSGGHTHLYRVDGIGSYTTLGRTLDDAVGEAFDKVAKLLGLGYPGGAKIDALASEGDPDAIRFPRPLLHKANLNFSFSGIKTAVLNYVKGLGHEPGPEELRDIAAGFQAAVVEVLGSKAFKAAEQQRLTQIVVAGGVACNSGLRRHFAELADLHGCRVVFPSPALCGDNAAMLGVAGDFYLRRGDACQADMNAVSNWPMDNI